MDAKVSKFWMTEYIKKRPKNLARQMVGRALWRLWRRQTQDEQASQRTTHSNNRGFSSADAFYGGIVAKYYAQHGTITEKMFGDWVAPRGRYGFPKVCKYSRQLNEIAKELNNDE